MTHKSKITPPPHLYSVITLHSKTHDKSTSRDNDAQQYRIVILMESTNSHWTVSLPNRKRIKVTLLAAARWSPIASTTVQVLYYIAPSYRAIWTDIWWVSRELVVAWVRTHTATNSQAPYHTVAYLECARGRVRGQGVSTPQWGPGAKPPVGV